jgi:3',5'-cyclic AMP phosphodiesterase CpdA
MERVVVLDNGSHQLRAGFAGELRPRVVMPNAAGRSRRGGVLLVGDLAYSDGYLPGLADWLAQSDALSRGAPLWVASGNHDGGWPGAALFSDVLASGGECGAPLAHMYPLPHPWSRASPWSAAALGPVCLFSLSTEHDSSPGSPQAAWLRATLRRMAGDPACVWILGLAHRPLYINSQDRASPSKDAAAAERLQADLDPILRAFRVNLVLSGHNHVPKHGPINSITCSTAKTDQIWALPGTHHCLAAAQHNSQIS